jgi:hypothetical protein
VAAKSKPDRWGDAVEEVPEKGDEAEERARMMRRALEPQADEVTWMRKLGLRWYDLT